MFWIEWRVKIHSTVNATVNGTENFLMLMYLASQLFTQYCVGGKIEKNEMSGECGAYGGGERCAQGSSGETWGKETTGETQM